MSNDDFLLPIKRRIIEHLKNALEAARREDWSERYRISGHCPINPCGWDMLSESLDNIMQLFGELQKFAKAKGSIAALSALLTPKQ